MKPLFLRMMQGLGDAVYQRPFVRAQSQVRPVFIDSCWPDIYTDLPRVRCVKPKTRYRTQAKNLARLADFPWSELPKDYDSAHFTYSLQQRGSISEELERRVGLAGRPFAFDLPGFGPAPVSAPYAVIRPVTERREWLNTARNPDPAYLVQAAEILKAIGYGTVCVADLSPKAETLVGEMPPADLYATAGELDQPTLFALIQHAAVVVGGPGWIVPTSIAYRTPAVILGGGQGAHNAPARLIDPRMNADRIRFVLPEPYCMCKKQRHRCTKAIPDFTARFREALTAVTGAWRGVAA